VRFSTIENVKIVCLESSDVCLMITESTILFMFNLDQCIELAFDQLVGRESQYKVYTILEYRIYCNRC